MTRKYEIVYILDSALEESQINEVLEALHQLLKTPGIKEPVTALSHWGKRTLAYEIAGKSIGYYVVVRVEIEPTALTEFERRVKLEDRILRYLIVVDEGLKPLTVPSSSDEDADAKKRSEQEAKIGAPAGEDA